MTSNDQRNSSDSILGTRGGQAEPLDGEDSHSTTRRVFVARTLGVTTALLTTGACAKSVAGVLSGDAVTLAGQPEWHFCSQCFGMFYSGDSNGHMGVCPGGGAHRKYGFNFVLPHNVPETPNTQRDWVFCPKCFGLYYGREDGHFPRAGVCPAGQAHGATSDSFNFVLLHDVPEPPGGNQQGWRFCWKCFGMFYAGDKKGRRGACPDGGSHAEYGFNFVLPHTAEFYKPPAPPAPPTISVSYDRTGPTFTVSGQGFLPNHVVHVRVVNNANPATVFFDTTANGSGGINFPITFAISPPQTYSFSANDARSNPKDATGTLWSNTVTLTAT
ncbi:hypothetical protein J7E97_28585 [Streptomyces sp. ISL-66]|uniref:hypothetical protein n=1 Tax=Streptomyces sp. ISL-66 TaxID=2819186 RepID=UPI001BE54C76|nr:hypothetical protein [Streptomyces sp. ISL-66]MBT2471717.1 hypothetical protein [Streptomyces sp. ISL-66]